MKTVAAFAYLCGSRIGELPLVSLSPSSTCQLPPAQVAAHDVVATISLHQQIESEVQAGAQSGAQAETEPEAGTQTDLPPPQSLSHSHSFGELQSLTDVQLLQVEEAQPDTRSQNCEVTFELSHLVKRSQLIAFSLVAFSEGGKEGM